MGAATSHIFSDAEIAEFLKLRVLTLSKATATDVIGDDPFLNKINPPLYREPSELYVNATNLSETTDAQDEQNPPSELAKDDLNESVELSSEPLRLPVCGLESATTDAQDEHNPPSELAKDDLNESVELSSEPLRPPVCGPESVPEVAEVLKLSPRNSYVLAVISNQNAETPGPVEGQYTNVRSKSVPESGESSEMKKCPIPEAVISSNKDEEMAVESPKLEIPSQDMTPINTTTQQSTASNKKSNLPPKSRIPRLPRRAQAKEEPKSKKQKSKSKRSKSKSKNKNKSKEVESVKAMEPSQDQDKYKADGNGSQNAAPATVQPISEPKYTKCQCQASLLPDTVKIGVKLLPWDLQGDTCIEILYAFNQKNKERVLWTNGTPEQFQQLDVEMELDNNGNPDSQHFLEVLPKILNQFDGRAILEINDHKIKLFQAKELRFNVQEIDLQGELPFILLSTLEMTGVQILRYGTSVQIRDKHINKDGTQKFCEVQGKDPENIKITSNGGNVIQVIIPSL